MCFFFALPISRRIPSDTSFPNTHSCSHFVSNTKSMSIASSRSVSSDRNCGKSKCGAIGIAPQSTAYRL